MDKRIARKDLISRKGISLQNSEVTQRLTMASQSSIELSPLSSMIPVNPHFARFSGPPIHSDRVS